MVRFRIDDEIVIDKDKQVQPREEIGRRLVNDVTNVVQPTELGESLRELNNDSRDPETGMTDIDMRTRLNLLEISSCLAVDTLINLRFLPDSTLTLTRLKKRLNVSADGKSREEIVRVVAGKKEGDERKGGIMNSVRQGLGMQPR